MPDYSVDMEFSHPGVAPTVAVPNLLHQLAGKIAQGVGGGNIIDDDGKTVIGEWSWSSY